MNQPEKRFKAGARTASIFANEVDTPDGKKQMKSVVLQRAYKDKDGNFQQARSFGPNDIPKATLVLQKAYEYLVTK